MVKEAIILAAGLGTRMSTISNVYGKRAIPKPLITVLGRPLLDWALTGLEYAGITQAIIVTGKEAKTIQQWVNGRNGEIDVETVYNPYYRLGNGISARYGLEVTGNRPALLIMADHLVDPELYEAAKSSRYWKTDLALVVDYDPFMEPQLNEPTRVEVDNAGRIVRIGKNISKWNCIDTGVFLVTKRLKDAIEEVFHVKGTCTMSEAVTQMIRENMKVYAIDSKGAFWLDIDTPEDLLYTENIILQTPLLRETFGIIPEDIEAEVPDALSEIHREEWI